MSRTVVLVHGAWVTPDFWGAIRQRFEATGFTVHVPAWPGLPHFGSGEGAAAAFRAAPPTTYGRLGIGDIADSLEVYLRRLGGRPILIGHSFGGLLVQLLLDRGVGAAGIALNPAPIRGATPDLTALRAIAPILLRPNGWNRPYVFSRERFGRLFANAAPPGLVDEAFARFVIPAPGRIFLQAAFGAHTGIVPQRRTQPLLISGGDADRLISPGLSGAAFAIQRDAPGRTDYVCFPGRSHFLTHEPGWEEVAETMLDWIRRLPEPATAPIARTRRAGAAVAA